MTAALITSIFLNIVLVGAFVFIAVMFSRALQSAVSTTDRVHDRSQKTLSSVLDRLMAVDFVQFHDARQERETEDGGFFPPEEDEEVEDGRLVDLRTEEALQEAAAEQRILAEDFPETGS